MHGDRQCDEAAAASRSPYVCLLGVSTRQILDARQFATVSQQAPAPRSVRRRNRLPHRAPASLPAGYAGSDTCALCHDDRATDVARSKHGQIQNLRTPAATLGCESCHGPGQAHVDDDAKGNIRRFGALKPAEVNTTCLSCHNRGAHAGWEGSTHEARNLSCTTCHSVHKPSVARASAREGDRDRHVRHLSSPAGHQDRAGGRPHAGARGQDDVLLVPQPARVDQQRQEPEDRQLRRRVVHELSHGDARTDALRACASP